MIDLSDEQLLNDEEILSALAIAQEDLNKLEDQGLQLIKIGDSHFYLGSTLLTFLRGLKGRPREENEGDHERLFHGQ